MLSLILKNAWNKWRIRRKLKRQVAPDAFKQLASQVDSLSVCAAMTCPNRLDMQCVQKNAQKLRSDATSPALSSLSVESRLALRQELIHSRQELIRGVQGAARPTRFLQ